METESLCYSKGNVQLDAFPQPPVFLQHLYEDVDSNGKHFLANIHKYNCPFQMTSFGCSEITMAGFNPSFRIQGQIHHLIGSIIPAEGKSLKFSQIYFIDNQDSEVAARCTIEDGLSQASLGASTNYCMIAISMLKYLKLPKRFLNKKLFLLIFRLLSMKPKSHQGSTPGGTIDLLVMR